MTWLILYTATLLLIKTPENFLKIYLITISIYKTIPNQIIMTNPTVRDFDIQRLLYEDTPIDRDFVLLAKRLCDFSLLNGERTVLSTLLWR